MSEAQATTAPGGQNASPAAGGKLAWIVVALVAGGAGAATPYLLPAHLGPNHGEQTVETPHVPPSPAAQVHPAYIEFGQVVANINEGRLSRYIRVSITLQVDETEHEEIAAKVEKHKAVLKNWLLSYLSDKDLEEIRGATGQNRLRREIQDQFNTVLFPEGYDRIDQVLFEEFGIQ